MKQLNYDLKQLCERNCDGSYATQNNRLVALQSMANTLDELGFKKMSAASLKPKHIDRLVETWKDKGLKEGSIKNYMTALRWWAGKIGKQSIVARDNDSYGIDRRKYVTGIDKSVSLSADGLDKVKDQYVRMSIELQAAFGLRREEAIKFVPKYALQTIERGCIQLKDTWTKGGKAREIPLVESAKRYQLDVLSKALKMAGNGSLIPSDRKYVQQLRVYEKQTANAGLSKLHGLRHMYAQNRYEELTGWKCPAKGGPLPRQLNQEQKNTDNLARLQVSQELGHERKQIVAIYLGG
jgi:site-specific recombinase XerC